MFLICYIYFFFNDTATTEIYTLSLHDALPILTDYFDHNRTIVVTTHQVEEVQDVLTDLMFINRDRKSTRLNSSHMSISYAVFCLKKKKRLPATIISRPVYNSLASYTNSIIHFT